MEGAFADPANPIVFLFFLQRVQALIFLVYIANMHRIFFMDFAGLTHERSIKPPEKKNWSSSTSDKGGGDELELPENSVPIGLAYNFNNSILIVPTEEPVTPDPKFDELVVGESDYPVRLVEYYDKQNAEIYSLPSVNLKYSFEGAEGFNELRATYKGFDENMEEAEHLGDLSYGFDYGTQTHVFAIKLSF